MGTVALFSVIGITAALKKKNKQPVEVSAPVKVAETPVISVPIPPKPTVTFVSHESKKADPKDKKKGKEKAPAPMPSTTVLPAAFPQSSKEDFPNIDRIFQLFST